MPFDKARGIFDSRILDFHSLLRIPHFTTLLMIRLSTAESETSQVAARQFRIRDLLLAMLLACAILGGGRIAGGAIDAPEGMLLAMAMVSILLASVFLRRRMVWYLFLAASLPLTALLVPGGPLVQWSLGAIAAAYFFFAALPVLASSPLQHRWRWVTTAAACQLAAAAFTPANAIHMIATAAPLSWLLAVAAVVFHYRALPHAAPPDASVKRGAG
jgi:hypothetical protein